MNVLISLIAFHAFGNLKLLNLKDKSPNQQQLNGLLFSHTLYKVQVVFAEAHAAGLFKGGIRRAAFSMGDLQALQPPEPTQPPRSTSQRWGMYAKLYPSAALDFLD